MAGGFTGLRRSLLNLVRTDSQYMSIVTVSMGNPHIGIIKIAVYCAVNLV